MRARRMLAVVGFALTTLSGTRDFLQLSVELAEYDSAAVGGGTHVLVLVNQTCASTPQHLGIHTDRLGSASAEQSRSRPSVLSAPVRFVLTVIIAAGWRYWLTMLTSFTVAHSITMTLGMLGVVRVSPSIVQPLILASIALMGWLNKALKATNLAARAAIVLACGLPQFPAPLMPGALSS